MGQALLGHFCLYLELTNIQITVIFIIKIVLYDQEEKCECLVYMLMIYEMRCDEIVSKSK